MVDYIRTPFALNGDQSVVPQTDGSGGVNFDQGYPIKYSQDPNTIGLSLDRANMNYLFWLLTQAVQQYQQHGFPDFITTIQNGGVPFPYAKDAVVLFGGVLYQSKIVANTTTPPSADWVAIDPYNKLIANASPIFTGNPTAPTPAANDNSTKLATTAFVLAQVSASSTKTVLTSSQIWSRSTLLRTFNHSLGKLPANGSLIWKCTSADGGFSVGDVVIMPLSAPQSNGVGVFGYMTKVTTTQCLLSVDTNSGLLLHQWNNQDVFEPASSKWTIEYSVSG